MIRDVAPGPARQGETMRRKRSDTIRYAVQSLQNEMNSKLHYLSSTTLTPISDTLHDLCSEVLTHRDMINALMTGAPNVFIRWVFREEHLTAEIVGDVVMYWPCKSIEKWYARENTTECYADLPVSFHNGVDWVEGYMETATGDISLTSPTVNCTISVQWYKLGASYYKMQGGRVTPVATEAMSVLTLRTKNSSASPILIPKWDNTWIYNATMFIQADRVSGMAGILDSRYTAFQQYVSHSTPAGQIQYMLDQTGLGMWGLYPYGVIFTVYKIACQVGGALFFYKTFMSPFLRKVNEDGPAAEGERDREEEEEQDPVSRYSHYRKTRPIHRKIADTITGR